MTRHALSLLLIPALVGGLGCDRLRGRVQVTVHGTLLGADGRPMPMAHVRLTGEDLDPLLATASADREGRFILKASVKPGPCNLVFSGVGHAWAWMHLPVQAPRSIRVQARLGVLDLAQDLSRAGLLVQDGSGAPTRVPLVPQPDGTYAAEVTGRGPVVRYQVDGVHAPAPGTARRAIEGTQGAGFEPHEGRSYSSILPLVEGRARVVFDPRRLPQGSREAVITFGPQDRDLAEIWRIDQERYRINVHLAKALASQDMREASALNEAFAQPFVQRWGEALEGETHPEVRQALGAALLMYGPRDQAALLKAFPPESPFWRRLGSWDKNMLGKCCCDATGDARTALQRIALDHLDAAFWTQRILPSLGPVDAERDLAALEAARPGHPLLKELRRSLKTSRARLAVGQPFPRFQLPSLEDPKQSLSLDAFKGKWLLVDVWATWCKPCVAELPGLHRAYAAFKGRGLEVLSLSFDARPEDIQAFRASQSLPMPWKQAWLEKGSEHAFARSLEVTTIPRVFLVGPDGAIRAMDGELKGPALEKTLARLMGRS